MCLSVCGAPHCKYYWPPQIFRPFAIPDVRAVIEGHLIEQVLLLNVVKFGGGGRNCPPCPFGSAVSDDTEETFISFPTLLTQSFRT